MQGCENAYNLFKSNKMKCLEQDFNATFTAPNRSLNKIKMTSVRIIFEAGQRRANQSINVS